MSSKTKQGQVYRVAGLPIHVNGEAAVPYVQTPEDVRLWAAVWRLRKQLEQPPTSTAVN